MSRRMGKTKPEHEHEPASEHQKAAKDTPLYPVLSVIFSALLLDLLAFTIILPLFPRILDYYDRVDGSRPESVFYQAKAAVRTFRQLIGGTGSELDIVLFGGFLGSLFSFLQFISSPWIGKWSDVYGRKPVLLLSMIGNGLSMILWTVSSSFPLFVLSRIVGGLTEGNVQMSIAMISDITTPQTRSRGLALVGIAFALGFTIGPPLGAYFASINLANILPVLARIIPLSEYASPAVFALVLIVIETIYMYIALPETLEYGRTRQRTTSNPSPSASLHLPASMDTLSMIHFAYLLLFSGMEFTLTFLVHDRFSFTHAQQGAMLGFTGILSALIQGGYVRRLAPGKEPMLVKSGMLACCIAVILLSIAHSTRVLYLAAVGFAFASATVINSLTSLASLACGKAARDDGEGVFLTKLQPLARQGKSLSLMTAEGGVSIDLLQSLRGSNRVTFADY
ncbi:hypothetical protein SeMB42_g07656 [Synchytrium endobioticum]|uniref:Major facilitator superfamily (MFS) profile domain-containing protein n=1 Tax=Synchytrium endobioticum TaxID=286115 RepID=A0A507C3A3_9FUNG|nr:hypothetical protein SeMB42_g07656 [Synchytrium endobioticum]